MNLPPALKPIQPYVILAKQFSTRDALVSYLCKMYAVELGIGAAKGDQASKTYILGLMDELSQLKQQLKTHEQHHEAMASDVVAQAHLENIALAIFDNADSKDRAGRFDKNLIKQFFTASHLFCVLKLKQFGEMSEEIETKMKYAKWKAVEIDRCLKNGITPTPGPPVDEDEFGGVSGAIGGVSIQDQQPPQIGFGAEPQYDPQRPPGVPPGATAVLPPPPSAEQRPTPAPRKNPPSSSPSPASSYSPQPAPAQPTPAANPLPQAAGSPIPLSGFAQLSREQIAQAQKYCKFALSSLDYNDLQSGANFMEKALRLLRTGRED